MLFVDEVLAVGGDRIETICRLPADHIMVNQGRVSPLVAIEFFAQSAAALMAYRAAGTNQPNVSGALLGTRKLEVFVDVLHVGDELRVEAIELWGQGKLAQLNCTLFRDDERIATGTINVVSGPV